MGGLVHEATRYTGHDENAVFKSGDEGLGYYRDARRCTLLLTPFLDVDASLPALPRPYF